MDEGVKIVPNEKTYFDIEQIDNEQEVFRQIPASNRTGTRPKQYPPEGHFSLRDGEDSLSFNWGKYIDVPKNFKLIGITKNNGNYLDFTGFKIFRYQVGFLKSIEKFVKIIHTPNFFGNPSPVGKPNNKSHTSLYFDVNDIGVRIALSDYCETNIDYSRCDFKVNSIKDEIDELRARENDTQYHKLWDFDAK